MSLPRRTVARTDYRSPATGSKARALSQALMRRPRRARTSLDIPRSQATMALLFHCLGEMQESNAYTQRVVPFRAGDGLDLNLIHVSGKQSAHRGPVLLVHGAGVRANLFRAPVDTTIVQFLVDRGYDVWLENWRASIDIAPNEWTLDQAAVYDHPQAVRTVLQETGASTLDAVIHCQGSTSFMMSALAGLVPEVKTIVANAVSLHTLIPAWSQFKIRYFMPMVRPLLPYVNPQWGLKAPNALALALSLGVRLTHHEC